MEMTILYKWMEEMGQFILIGKKNLQLISESRVNVQLVYGSKDKIFSGYTKQHLKNSDLIYIVENEGHLCNISAPEKINKLMEE